MGKQQPVIDNAKLSDLVADLQSGKTRALAKAITLVESSRQDHQQLAQQLLTEIMPATGRSLRLGFSGAPGAGKSTWIEAFGVWLVGEGHRVAVLAVDPSSSVRGGSILGDKTRMDKLARSVGAYIRPSPSSGSLGGVAAKTREAMLLCEAAGYDVIIVETVGVGQSETCVASMVDCFTLIQLPNAGDDLQAIKKGIVELADLVLINKSDIDSKAAKRTAVQWQQALHLLQPNLAEWSVPVITVSGKNQAGIEDCWQAVRRFEAHAKASGAWQQKRQQQALAWMWSLIEGGLRQAFHRHQAVAKQVDDLSAAVKEGRSSPYQAASTLLRAAGFSLLW